MIIDILIVLAFVAMGIYSIRSFYPLRVVSTVPKPVEKTDEVTAVERIEKKDKKPRRICKGWSNHGMLGRRH